MSEKDTNFHLLEFRVSAPKEVNHPKKIRKKLDKVA